jgi:hypothetical protein
MEARPPGSVPQRMHNPFSFDPDNGAKHGDTLFDAVQQVMKAGAMADSLPAPVR